MIVGSQFSTPEGYKCLEKGHSYHYLYADRTNDRILVVEFVRQDNKQYRANLLALARTEFEEGIELGRKSSNKRGIVLNSKQPLLPPWLLYRICGEDERAPIDRRMTEITARRIAERAACIEPLLQRFDALHTVVNPERAINALARTFRNATGKPRFNETRARLWLYSYKVFGEDTIALAPSYGDNGRWDRAKATTVAKLGREHRRGKDHGHNAAPLKAEMLKGYDKHHKRKRSLQEVYDRMVRDKKLFGCLSRKTSKNKKIRKEYFHPEGKPFPSIPEFRYHMEVALGRRWLENEPDPYATMDAIRKLGRKQMRIDRGGAERERVTKFDSTGSFINDVGFLMERVRCDAYWLKELPKSLFGDEHLEPILVVRARDEVSGKIVGIGFCIGGEIQAAYDCMLFSMVVDKVFYCSLFGLAIQPGDWEGKGRGREIYFDRGPAAAANFEIGKTDKPHIFGLSPSSSPMSNATVEASHPKDWKIHGKQNFVASSFTAPELFKRELLRAIADNQTFDVSKRKIDGRTFGSPNEIWTYLSSRWRNAADDVAFDTAVRTYLTKKDFAIKEDGLYLYGSRFDSPALRRSGVLSKADARIKRTLPGYIVDYGVGRAWIDIKGRLVEVVYVPETRTHGSLRYPTAADLQHKEENEKAVMADFAEHRAAAIGEARERLKEETGKDWDSGQLRTGKRTNKSQSARQQTADLKKFSRRRAA